MNLFGVECVKTDDVERVRHGTGHCLSDVLKIRTNGVKRAPDVVVYVTSQDTVVELVKFAKSQRLCLIPFGGGTNVTEALQCPSYDVEPRCIVSVDMRRMNKIIWVNKEDYLRIISMQKGAAIAEVFDRLCRATKIIESVCEFMHDSTFGYITSCPTNLGTALRGSVLVKLPNLYYDDDEVLAITNKYQVDIRGKHG